MMVRAKLAAVLGAGALLVGGCGFSPYDIPLPGGADTGDDPYDVTIEFADVLDLVPQSGVRVNEAPVGRVTKIELDGWNALVTVRINGEVELPANAEATIRQTSLLGEKFVSLAPPATGASGRLNDGDRIPLERSGRNPEIEEVLASVSLLLNGGALERTKTIVQEFNQLLEGRDDEVKGLISEANDLLGQLDANKHDIIETLEKVNRLAIETSRQTESIEQALAELPAALRILDGQREDIIALLKALNRLGDVGERVIRASKDDLVEALEELGPVVQALADTGDDLTSALGGFVSYPFTDGFVGGSLQAAKDTHYGDFANLSLRLDLSLDQLCQFLDLGALCDILAGLAGSGAAGTQEVPEDDLTLIPVEVGFPDAEEPPGDVLGDIGEILGEQAPVQPSPDGAGSSGGSGGGLCAILGTCRTAVGGSGGEADLDDVFPRAVTGP